MDKDNEEETASSGRNPDRQAVAGEGERGAAECGTTCCCCCGILLYGTNCLQIYTHAFLYTGNMYTRTITTVCCCSSSTRRAGVMYRCTSYTPTLLSVPLLYTETPM